MLDFDGEEKEQDRNLRLFNRAGGRIRMTSFLTRTDGGGRRWTCDVVFFGYVLGRGEGATQMQAMALAVQAVDEFFPRLGRACRELME